MRQKQQNQFPVQAKKLTKEVVQK